MKHNIFKFLLVMVLIFPVCCLFTACGEKDPVQNETPSGGGGTSTPAKPIATIGNFEVKGVEIFHLEDDWYNLEISLKNVGAETEEFDFSKIILKLEDVEISHDGDTKEYDASEYFKWTFQIDTGQGLSVGQDIDVYYEEEKLTTVKIKEF